MRHFFTSFAGNLLRCFQGRMLVRHGVAILLTAMLVWSHFDWWYYEATRNPDLRFWMMWAARIGFFVPILLPLYALIIGYACKSEGVIRTGWAVMQSEILGSLISSGYKAFTGRAHPAFTAGADISQVFHFGFFRGGVFWGWPSSHTTIAFAASVAIWTLFPKRRWLGWLAMLYALYIGVGVSMTIHWCPDFVAGAIIGAVIGRVVGRSFAEKTS